MKFHFGHGVLVVLLLFMAGMSYLVYRCTQQSISLVNPEYYAQELKYSEQMKKERNSQSLGQKVDIAFSAASQQVVVKYPHIQSGSEISGEILFFKPDNSGDDFTVPVKADVNHLQQISASKLHAGAWRIKINWKAEGISYYNEEKIFIN